MRLFRWSQGVQRRRVGRLVLFCRMWYWWRVIRPSIRNCRLTQVALSMIRLHVNELHLPSPCVCVVLQRFLRFILFRPQAQVCATWAASNVLTPILLVVSTRIFSMAIQVTDRQMVNTPWQYWLHLVIKLRLRLEGEFLPQVRSVRRLCYRLRPLQDVQFPLTVSSSCNRIILVQSPWVVFVIAFLKPGITVENMAPSLRPMQVPELSTRCAWPSISLHAAVAVLGFASTNSLTTTFHWMRLPPRLF